MGGGGDRAGGRGGRFGGSFMTVNSGRGDTVAVVAYGLVYIADVVDTVVVNCATSQTGLGGNSKCGGSCSLTFQLGLDTCVVEI